MSFITLYLKYLSPENYTIENEENIVCLLLNSGIPLNQFENFVALITLENREMFEEYIMLCKKSSFNNTDGMAQMFSVSGNLGDKISESAEKLKNIELKHTLDILSNNMIKDTLKSGVTLNHKGLEKLENSINKISEEGIKINVTHDIPSMNEMLENIKDLISVVGVTTVSTSAILSHTCGLLACLIGIMKCKDFTARIFLFTTWLITSGCINMFGKVAFEAIYGADWNVIAQADKDENVSEVFVNIIKYWIGMKSPYDFDKVSRQATNIRNNLLFLKESVNFVSVLSNSIKKVAAYMGIIEDLEYEAVVKIDRQIDEWMEKVDELHMLNVDVFLRKDNSKIDELTEIVTKGHRLKILVGKCEDLLRNKVVVFMNTLNIAQELLEHVKSYRQRNTVRAETMVLGFYGPPGTGKTECATLIGKLFYKFLHEKQAPDNEMMLFKNTNDVYWDAYRGQDTVIFDDPFQSGDYSKYKEIITEIIHLGHSGAHQLNIAKLEGKTGVYFVSPLLIMTSNESYEKVVRDAKIQDSMAFLRRITFHVRLVQNPDWSPEKSKVGNGEIDTDKWRFELDRLVISKVGEKQEFRYVHDKFVSFNELLLLICEKYNENIVRLRRQDNIVKQDIKLPKAIVAQMDKEDQNELKEEAKLSERRSVENVEKPRNNGKMRYDEILELFKIKCGFEFDKATKKIFYCEQKHIRAGFIENIFFYIMEISEHLKDKSEATYLLLNIIINMDVTWIFHLQTLWKVNKFLGTQNNQNEKDLHVSCGKIKIANLSQELNAILFSNILILQMLNNKNKEAARSRNAKISKEKYDIDPSRVNTIMEKFYLYTAGPLETLYNVLEVEGVDLSEILRTVKMRFNGSAPGVFDAERKVLRKIHKRAEEKLNDYGKDRTQEQIYLEHLITGAEVLSILQNPNDINIEMPNPNIENKEFFMHYKQLREELISYRHNGFYKQTQRLKEGLVTLKDKVKEYKKPLIVLGGIIAVVGSAWWLLSQTKSDNEEEENGQAEVDYPETRERRVKFSKVRASRINFKSPITPNEAKAQMGDEQAFRLKDFIYKNMYKNSWIVDDIELKKPTVFGLFIHENYYILPRHFYTLQPETSNLKLKFINVITNIVYEINMDEIQYIKVAADLALLKIFHKAINPHRSLLKHIVTEEDLKRITTFNGAMLTMYSGTPEVLLTDMKIDRFMRYSSPYDEDNEVYELDNYIKFGGPTFSGQCGSPYLISNTLFPRKIVGIHVAGYTNEARGIGMIITQEMFENEIQMKVVAQSDTLILPKTLTIIEKVPSNEISFIPTQSVIKPSPMVGILQEPRFMPAKLKPFVHPKTKEKLDPLQLNINKFDVRKVKKTEINFELLQAVSHNYTRRIPFDGDWKVMNIEDAVNGIPTDPYTDPISMSKSAGYTRWHKISRRGKWDFFNCTLCGKKENCACDNRILKPESFFYERILECIKKLSDKNSNEWENLEFLFKDLLKDEKREIEDVLKGKTRIFSGGPVDHFVLCKMYFNAFVVCFKKYPLLSGYSGCVNPHSREWKKMFNYLFRNEEYEALPGDYSRQDATQQSFMSELFDECVNEWYSQEINKLSNIEKEKLLEDNLVRTRLNHHTYNAKHIIYDIIYQAFGPNPSGQYLTSVFNTWTNNVANIYAAVRAYQDGIIKTRITPFNYWDHFTIQCLGDDHVECTYIKEYTLSIKKKYIEELGYRYTLPDKTEIGTGKERYKWNEIEYLKRSFRKENNEIFAPLNEKVLKEIMNWMHKDTPPSEAMRANIQCVLIESFHYGKQYYYEIMNILVPAYNNLFREFGDPLDIYSYEELLFKFIEGKMPSPESIYTHKKNKFLPLLSFDIPIAQMDRDNIVKNSEQTHVTTSFEESTGQIINESTNIVPIYKQMDPYEDQTPDILLKRQYVLGTLNISSSSVFGTLVGSYNIPDCLSTITPLVNILERFEYLSSGFTFEFRWNTNQLQYGQLLICYVPFYNPLQTGALTRGDNIYSVCSAESIILDANKANTVIMKIPQVTPTLAFQKGWITPSIDSSAIGGQIRIHVLSPIQQINLSSPITVSLNIFISLDSPRVSGLIAQMDKEEEVKSSGNKLSTIGDTISNVGAVIKTIPPVSRFGDAAVALGSITNMVSRYVGKSKTHDLEGERIMLPRALSNPSLVHGTDFSEVLGLSAESKIATDYKMYGPDNVDYDLIDNYKMLPNFIEKFTVSSDDNPNKILFNIMLNPYFISSYQLNHTSPSFLLNGFFNYHRCGYQFLLNFVCNEFISFRIRVVYIPIESVGVIINDTNVGDFVSKVYDIQGTTSVTFKIPYLSSRPYLQTYDPGVDTVPNDFLYSGSIRVLLQTKLQDFIDEEARVDCLVFGALSSDSVFAGIKEPFFYPIVEKTPTYPERQSSTKNKDKTQIMDRLSTQRIKKKDNVHVNFEVKNNVGVAQGGFEKVGKGILQNNLNKTIPEKDQIIRNLRVLFRTEFEPLIKAKEIVYDRLCMSDIVTRWTEVFRRPMLVKVLNYAEDVNNIVQWYSGMTGDSNALRWMYQIFQVYGGSFKFTLVPKKNGNQVYVRVRNDLGMVQNDLAQNMFYGGSFIDSVVSNSREIIVPFYWPHLYLTSNFYNMFNYQRLGIMVQMSPAGTHPIDPQDLPSYFVYMSVGPDFFFTCPSSLPDYTISP